MNYYEHHLGDYAQATSHLTFVEDAAYSRLLRKYYAEEQPLPADLRAVQRLVGARTDEEREAVEIVLNEFFTLEADGWHNKRADAEIAKVRAKGEKARASAEARWSKNASASETHNGRNASASEKHANASEMDADASETHNGRNALPSPVTSNQSQKEKQKRDKPADLLPGVHPEILRDFLAIRKAKKMPLTETAAAGLKREAERAGVSLADAIRTCCERGWAGFKADWLSREHGNVTAFPGKAKASGAQPEILPELTA